jgi:glycosyltransferase involved in cell wall biosynthesis
VGGIDARDAFNPSTVDAETLARVRARLALPSGATVIGFVGRLEREKGVAELLEAFAALRRSRSRVHLVVLGNMEVKDRLPDAVLRTLREDTHVHWLSDYIDARELAAAYALMDVVALPSYREGFPSVLLEAAAMARPAVSTHVPGCSDAIVNGVTGTLVPVRDAAALASALARYLDDPPLREAHGDAARVRALADYAPERIWEQTLDEYDAVLGASARRLA